MVTEGLRERAERLLAGIVPGGWAANGEWISSSPRLVRDLLAEIDRLTASQAPEVCICAAIRCADGRIVRGQRHGHCLEAASGAMRPRPYEQGFVTSRNRFVDRREARQLQNAAGIPSVAVSGYRLDLLFSEDLY